MSGICLTCSTKEDLTVLSEDDWNIFDFILHPHSKTYYNTIRNNTMSRICINCETSLQYVKNFRKSATHNFLQLMNTWNQVNKNPLGAEELMIKREPGDDDDSDLSRVSQSEFMQKIRVGNGVITLAPLTQQCTVSKDNKIKEEILELNLEIEHPTNIVKTEVQNEWKVAQLQEMEVPLCTTAWPSTAISLAPYTAPSLAPSVAPSAIQPRIATSVQPIDMVEAAQSQCTEPSTSVEHKCNRHHTPLQSIAQATHEQITTRSPVTCTVCTRTLSHKYSLRRHMKRHVKTDEGKVFCELCDKWFTKAYYKKHFDKSSKHLTKEQRDALRMPCPICRKRLHDKDSLRQHMKTHAEVNTADHVYCETCDRWFAPAQFKTHLSRSLKHISKDDYKFICDLCDSRHLNKANITRHIMVVHMKLTRFTLAKHMVVHTGERPYACKECGATFGHNGAMHTHIKLKHHNMKRTNSSALEEKMNGGKTAVPKL